MPLGLLNIAGGRAHSPRRRMLRAGLPLLIFVLCLAPYGWGLDPAQVLILVNKDSGISSQVARMYQKLRAVPEVHVLRLSLGPSRQISMEAYRTRLAAPLRKYLQAHPEIRCILTTAGVPYRLEVASDNGVAVDSELAAVLLDPPPIRRLGRPNPFFLEGTNSRAIADPRMLNMVLVSRLDGIDLKLITRMVQDAVAAEKTGLQGPVFGDAQGLDGASGYARADRSIRDAIDRLSRAGFQSTLDLNSASWKQPQSGVGEQAAGAAFYVGWYDLNNFQNIFGRQGLARGAIAWHVASSEAVNIWDESSTGWCINLLRRGAAVTIGPVSEPYAEAFPRGGIFVERLLTGATVAESYWLSIPQVSWNMVLLGDPLYRPFAANSKPR